MTTRERMEARAERRREWAASRSAKAAAGYRVGDEHRDASGRMDWALVTQPGYIPERARINRAHERAAEHAQMAAHHIGKAVGTEQALERTIFTDDPNAAEALESKAAAIEAAADRCKAINTAFRRAPGADFASKLAALIPDTLTGDEALRIARSHALQPYHAQPFPAYHLTNLRANARRCRERIKEVAARAQRDAEVAASPSGVVVSRHPEYDVCSVRFAEKPSRDILEALRANLFHYSGGAWSGQSSRLPECVAALEHATA